MVSFNSRLHLPQDGEGEETLECRCHRRIKSLSGKDVPVRTFAEFQYMGSERVTETQVPTCLWESSSVGSHIGFLNSPLPLKSFVVLGNRLGSRN